jgi:GT2 family glycosyltransferase
MSLSIVIPSHNRPDLLRLCLQGVTRHAPPDTEILVVDDGSPGATVSAQAAAFPGVGVLRLPHQGGFCQAVQAGIEHTRQAIVQVLNDDVEVSAGWAEPALRRFADPTIGAVAPLTLWGPRQEGRIPRIDSAGDRYLLAGIAGKRGHGRALEAEFLQPGLVFGASASGAFYRRGALSEAGGFPEGFGAYFEDVDLAFRLHWAGWQTFYEPASCLWHRVSSSYQPSAWLLEQQSCNEERIYWRNLPRGDLLRGLASHLAVLVGKAWKRWRRGELVPFVRGRLRALMELSRDLAHRHSLQKGRAPDTTQWGLEKDWRALFATGLPALVQKR